MSAKCDGVSLRLSPRTSAVRKTVLPAGAQVYAVTKVSGGSWRASCAGTAVSGSTWYRISIIGGTRVSSRFGVSYVYAAAGLLRKTTQYPKYTTCDGVVLRTKPDTSASRKAVLPKNTKVLAVARVTGGTWITTCNGKALVGHAWYRITTVAGERVSSRYGVTYVYASAAVFSARTQSPTPPPAATPTPKPAATPTPKPAATPTPTHPRPARAEDGHRLIHQRAQVRTGR